MLILQLSNSFLNSKKPTILRTPNARLQRNINDNNNNKGMFHVNKRTVSHKSAFDPTIHFNNKMIVFSAPQKYIQGPNVMSKVGELLSFVSAKNAVIIATKTGKAIVEQNMMSSLQNSSVTTELLDFQGECSIEEIQRIVKNIQQLDKKIDCIVAVGGGKLIDASKCVANEIGSTLVVCPTLSSNDGPCSSLSVMYTPEGECTGVEFFKANPNLVIVDSDVIMKAPIRTLVAGMGDAISTYYEAEVCYNNPSAVNTLGSRPSLSALKLAKLCKNTLFVHSFDAIQCVNHRFHSQSLEYVIEANTLLSGLGFESGGLAASHAVAQALTSIDHVHKKLMHGEMVAMGLLTQLALLGNWEEAETVANYLSLVGLPVHFEQLKVDVEKDDLSKVYDITTSFNFINNMPITVTKPGLLEAMKSVNVIGQKYLDRNGNRTYIPEF